MRYTTVIDLTEFPGVYRNRNARLVYLHLVLKSGWHNDDRDLIEISIRSLASGVGLTLSATRHALAQLEKAGLINRQGSVWLVRKWILEEPVTPRARTRQQQRQLDVIAERRRVNEQRDREREIEAIERRRNFEAGKSSFMLWYESLLAKAEAGDEDARRRVESNRAAYERQVEQMKKNQKA